MYTEGCNEEQIEASEVLSKVQEWWFWHSKVNNDGSNNLEQTKDDSNNIEQTKDDSNNLKLTNNDSNNPKLTNENSSDLKLTNDDCNDLKLTNDDSNNLKVTNDDSDDANLYHTLYNINYMAEMVKIYFVFVCLLFCCPDTMSSWCSEGVVE